MSSDSDGDEVDAFSAVLRKFLPGGLGEPTEAVTTPTSARAARPFDAAAPATPSTATGGRRDAAPATPSTPGGRRDAATATPAFTHDAATATPAAPGPIDFRDGGGALAAMEPDTPVARGTLEAVRRAVADARDRQFSIDEDGRRVREEALERERDEHRRRADDLQRRVEDLKSDAAAHAARADLDNERLRRAAADAGLEAQRRDRRSRRAAARAEVAALRCVERALKGVADEVIRTRTSFTEDQPRLAWRASPRKARRRSPTPGARCAPCIFHLGF